MENLRVVSLIEQFRAVEIRPTDELVAIKSSVLDSLWWAVDVALAMAMNPKRRVDEAQS